MIQRESLLFFPTPSRFRRGISRVEVALLLVFLFLFLGLVLIFLRSGWEKSHRVHCAENLKKIGAGIHRFREQKNHPYLPASAIDKQYATWAVQIAPYLATSEAESFQNWDFALPYYLQAEEVRTRVVPLYFCPARDRDTRINKKADIPSGGQPEPKPFPGALGDYACSLGDGGVDPWYSLQANGAIIPAKVIEKEGQKILKWQGLLTLEDLRNLRGISNTVLVGEKHVPRDKMGDLSVGDGSLYNGDYPGSFARIGGPGYGLAPSPTAPYQQNFGSYHPGLCQFLMADGSIRPLTTSVNEQVLGQLTNRNP